MKMHNLKFYRTENGVVKPMQVKIAMQGEFLNLLQFLFPSLEDTFLLQKQ